MGQENSIGGKINLNAIYFAAGLIFLAFICAGAVVVNLASQAANMHALEIEKRVVRSELERLVSQTIDQQAEISYWDDSIAALAGEGPVDRKFAEREIADWLSADMGFSEFALVNVDGSVRLGVVRHKVEDEGAQSLLAESADELIGQARRLYREERYRSGRGYLVHDAPGHVVPPIQASAYRMFRGVPTVIVAQVMIPESAELSIPADSEVVLVSAKPVTARMLTDISKRLVLNDVNLRPGTAVDEHQAKVPAPDAAGAGSLVLAWTPKEPRKQILAEVLPVGVGVSLVLFAALGFIVFRHSSTLRALLNSEAANRFLASHDHLTGLANRKEFEAALTKAFQLSRSAGFAVLSIDLDKFKSVNDTHGHQAGDAVLKEVAERFRKTVGEKGIVARMGGDEFVVLVIDGSDVEALKWLSVSLIEEACKPVAYHGAMLQVGASVGIAIAPDDGGNERELILAADDALYESKRGGRGRATARSGMAENQHTGNKPGTGKKALASVS